MDVHSCTLRDEQFVGSEELWRGYRSTKFISLSIMLPKGHCPWYASFILPCAVTARVIILLLLCLADCQVVMTMWFCFPPIFHFSESFGKEIFQDKYNLASDSFMLLPPFFYFFILELKRLRQMNFIFVLGRKELGLVSQGGQIEGHDKSKPRK